VRRRRAHFAELACGWSHKPLRLTGPDRRGKARRRWAARARRRTAQRQISGCVREDRGRVSRSRHQGAAARRQTSQAGVTRARDAEIDNPGRCATPHAADGSARRQGRRAVCRTAKARVEEGNRDICVSFGRRNASSADEGWLPDRSETLRSGGTSVLANVRWHFIHAYSACQRNRSIADRATRAFLFADRLCGAERASKRGSFGSESCPVLINGIVLTSRPALSGRPCGAHLSGGMIRCARRVSNSSMNDLAESW
jgi:hypothetical protein